MKFRISAASDEQWRSDGVNQYENVLKMYGYERDADNGEGYINLKSLEELMEFMKDVECEVVISYSSNSILIYDYYLE